jgi:hypothetical protein
MANHPLPLTNTSGLRLNLEAQASQVAATAFALGLQRS